MKFAAIALLGLSLSPLGGVASAEPLKFNPRQIVKPFPPLTDPKTVTAREAAAELRAEELVIGVTVNGESRAYPINMLNGPTREIINDRLAGRWIATTW